MDVSCLTHCIAENRVAEVLTAIQVAPGVCLPDAVDCDGNTLLGCALAFRRDDLARQIVREIERLLDPGAPLRLHGTYFVVDVDGRGTDASIPFRFLPGAHILDEAMRRRERLSSLRRRVMPSTVTPQQ